MLAHIEWLESIGMVVNVGKTEAVLFINKDHLPIEIEIRGSSFKTQKAMNILGVTFDAQMKWNVQLDKVICKGKRLMQGLRILRII